MKNQVEKNRQSDIRGKIDKPKRKNYTRGKIR